MAPFPVDPGKGVGGAPAKETGYSPTPFGTKVYLSAGGDFGAILGRVEAAGGKIVAPKTSISSQVGFTGAFIDTEGNWVGLHSMQ